MKTEVLRVMNNNIKKKTKSPPSLKSSNSSTKSINSKAGGVRIRIEDEPQDNSNINVSDPNNERKPSGWSFGWGIPSSLQKSPTISNSEAFPQAVTSDDDDLASNHTTNESANNTNNNNNNNNNNENLDIPTGIPTQQEQQQPESWMSWGRKFSRSQNLSSESLKKMFQESNNDAKPSSNRAGIEPSNELLSRPKEIIAHDEAGKTVEVKASRSASWSFWNSSSSSTQPKDNVKEDAVLFEPQDVPSSSKKAHVSKQPTMPNIIVPHFEEVLPQESLVNKVRNLVTFAQPKHLQRVRPKKFKRVLIVGVHGFFPNKMLRPLIGEPTGTSHKFANEAEQAILKWTKKHSLDISIQKIALEKEGRIFDRVEYFYEIMEKWKDEIQKSDFVFFACHSQGTPVTISLLSKLIENGIIENDNLDKKIGILAMAGVNNGPYYGVDQKFFVKAYSTIEHDSMRELFEFQNFDSTQSKKYLESLRIIISHNTKICFVGSIDDQLVPLYSSIASHIEHPNIYRACYIDGGSNTPSFVSRVVAISLWLKNIGYSDHGIIKEISNSLAGPLTGGGHSKIYNDPNVYELAIQFILGTNDLNVSNPQPVHFHRFDIKSLSNNPYHLPWCMRGLIYESIRRIPRGGEQIEQISAEFDQWKPESKVLKDLKYRLSAIKAKL